MDTNHDGIVKNGRLNAFPRSRVGEVTNGAISPGYMANLDSKGLGPEGGFYWGRKKMYTTDPFWKWFEQRISTV